jgi:hypothetical protein
MTLNALAENKAAAPARRRASSSVPTVRTCAGRGSETMSLRFMYKTSTHSTSYLDGTSFAAEHIRFINLIVNELIAKA